LKKRLLAEYAGGADGLGLARAQAFDGRNAAEKLAQGAERASVADLSKNKTDELVAATIAASTDVESRGGAANLAAALGNSLGQISKMPDRKREELAEALERLNVGTPELKMAAGMSMDKVFGGGYNTQIDQFVDPAAEAAFAARVAENPVAVAAALPTKAMDANGGYNNVSMNVVNNVSVEQLQEMNENGNHSQAFNIVSAAQAIRDGNGIDALASYRSQMEAAGIGEKQMAEMTSKFQDLMSDAKDSATKLLENLNKEGNVGVAKDMTFTGVAKNNLKGAISGVVSDVVSDAEAAIGRVGKKAKSAANSATSTLGALERKANTVKRMLTKAAKRF
jgi:hypothetical protein